MHNAINIKQLLFQTRYRRLKSVLAQAKEAAVDQNFERQDSSLLRFVQHCSKSSPDRSFTSISLCNCVPNLFSEIVFKLNNYLKSWISPLWLIQREPAEWNALINLWTTLNKLHILLYGRFTATADLIKCFIKQNIG